MKKTQMANLCFLGFGAWGGALAIHLARHGVKNITAWEFLESLRNQIRSTGCHPSLGGNAKVPETIRVVANLSELPVNSQTILVVAVASSHVKKTLKQLMKGFSAGGSPPWACVILSKGLEPESLSPLSETAAKTLGLSKNSIFALSGPTIAKELLSGGPTLAVLAGTKNPKRDALQKTIERGNFKLWTSTDTIGAQVGGSMKNIYALGYGILDGLNATANAKAVYLTKALREMALVAQKMGGLKETIYGPAGLGDLMTTSLSVNSRNSRLGRLLAGGKSLKESQKEIGMVTEGVDAAGHYARLNKTLKLKLPLLDAIRSCLKTPTQPKKLLLSLG